MKDLTRKNVIDFWAFMTDVYDTTVLAKNAEIKRLLDLTDDMSLQSLKSLGTEIYAIGLFLDKLGIVNVHKFMKKYATTLGDRIYLPFEVGDRTVDMKKQVILCVHEHQHVIQYKAAPVSFMIRYLADRSARALFEAEAYRCNIEMEYMLTGKLPDVKGYAQNLRHYGCNDGEIAIVEKALRLASQTIAFGGVTTRASRMAKHWWESQTG